jgi:membrane associated rhomboid family serine protease
MIEVALSDTATVRVDACKLCHFVWFDASETETLVPLPPPPKPNILPAKAREAVAMFKVEALAEEARGTDADSAPPDELWQEIAGYFGMPVEYDAPPLDRKPWLTWSLCLAIIVASVSAFPNLHEVVQRFGLIPAEATRLSGLTFATSFFLHVGLIHLLGNMYFLFVFGAHAENFLGRARYLFLIFFAAIVGDLAHIAADPYSRLPCIGASGGIAGVITFYALAFPEVKLGFLLRWGWVWLRWIRLSAWFVLVLWIFFQLIGAWEQIAGVSPVSSLAHLGGALTGLACWIVWRKRVVIAPLLPTFPAH